MYTQTQAELMKKIEGESQQASLDHIAILVNQIKEKEDEITKIQEEVD